MIKGIQFIFHQIKLLKTTISIIFNITTAIIDKPFHEIVKNLPVTSRKRPQMSLVVSSEENPTVWTGSAQKNKCSLLDCLASTQLKEHFPGTLGLLQGYKNYRELYSCWSQSVLGTWNIRRCTCQVEIKCLTGKESMIIPNITFNSLENKN